MARLTLIVHHHRYSVLRMCGNDGINRLFKLTVWLCVTRPIVVKHWRHQNVKLHYQHHLHTQVWHAHCVSLSSKAVAKQWLLQLQLAPILALKYNQYGPRVWRQLSIPEIISDLLQPAIGFIIHLRWHLSHRYDPLPYVQQPPGESDFACFERLLFSVGIHYVCDCHHSIPTLHLYDSQHHYPKLTPSTIVYNPNLDRNMEHPHSFYQVQVHATQPYDHIVVRDHQQHNIHAKVAMEHTTSHLDYFGVGVINKRAAQQRAHAYYYAAQHHAWHLKAYSSIQHWRIGHYIKCDLEALHAAYSQDYLIAAIHYEYNSLNAVQKRPFIKLAKLDWPYCHRPKEHPKLATAITMQTCTTQEGSTLNEEGNYAVSCHYDNLCSAQIFPPIPRVQLSVAPPQSQPQGWHLPWPPYTDVAVAFIHGDPNHAIILGSLANEQQPSLTTASNYNQNKIISAQQQSLTMDDDANQQSLQLATPTAQQHITMQVTPQALLTIKAQFGSLFWQTRGAMQLSAKNCIQLNSEKRYESHSKNDMQHSSQQNIKLKARAIHYHAKANIDANASKQTDIQTCMLQLQANTQLQLTAQGHAGISLQSQQVLQCQAQTIHILASGTGQIIIQQGANKIIIGPNSIEIISQQLKVHSNNFTMQGAIQYL